jgi:uncharacterized protein DUF6475
MKSNEMSEFSRLLTTVSALYKHPMNELTMEIYWQALKGFELSVIQQAFHAHIRNPDSGQFMPKPADILRYVNGSSEAQALQAWTRVWQTMRDVGSYDSLVFDDAILHRVIEDMGGWIRLSEYTAKEMDFLMHEFKKRYAAYVLHPPTSYPRQLTGRFAWQNSQFGHESQPPLLIGDTKKAQEVYQQGRAPELPRPITPLLSFRNSTTPEESVTGSDEASDHFLIEGEK